MPRTSRKNIFQEQTSASMTPKAVSYATWGYARISIDGERSEDSIESQIAIINDYINNASRTDLEAKGVFTDLGFSGTNFDRPGYTELLAGIMNGDVQCVVVKDLSRLGRTYIEVGELLFDTFPAHNVRFISVNDQYDSFADDASRKKLLILFKNLVNHMYSKDLGKKIRSAHNAKKKRGELAGNVPYGYKRGSDGITLAFDDDAAETVRMVFDMRLSGLSAVSITKLLNQKGIPSPLHRRYLLGQITHQKYSKPIVWNVGMISRMLKQETYTGTLIQGKYYCDGKRHGLLPKEQWIRHDNAHPAIISKEQFEAVLILMEASAKKYEKNGKKGEMPENRYKGKIICTRCGKVVPRLTGGAKRKVRFYYRCTHCDNELKFRLGLKKTAQLSVIALDEAVAATLQTHMDSLLDFDKLIAELTVAGQHNSYTARLNQEKQKWEKVIYSADKILSSAYAHHLDGILEIKEFKLVRLKVENDKKEAAVRLSHIENVLRKFDDLSVINKRLRDLCDKFRSGSTIVEKKGEPHADANDAHAPTREMVELFIARIELTPLSNEIHIVLNYSDELVEYRDLINEYGTRQSEQGVAKNA